MNLHIITRSTPRGSKRWQQPGYVAVVLAPDGWPTTRPLSIACMRRDGVLILSRRDVADLRYSGPRSDYGQALAEAESIVERVRTEPDCLQVL